MNYKIRNSLFYPDLIQREAGNPYEAKPREKDLIEEFEQEGERLGIFFNGMQERINNQHPVALFTDKKTKSTFGVKPGQSVKLKLIETRGRFLSVKGRNKQ